MRKTQCHLLAMRTLTFVLVKDKCLADELAMAARTNVEHGETADGAAHSVSHQQQYNRSCRRKEQCACCGRDNHLTKDCHYKSAMCYKCKVRGHISRACGEKDTAPPKKDTPQYKRLIRYVKVESNRGQPSE